MHASNSARRPRLRRIIVTLVLTLALAEPLIMYLSLQHERDHRAQAREATARLPAGEPGR